MGKTISFGFGPMPEIHDCMECAGGLFIPASADECGCCGVLGHTEATCPDKPSWWDGPDWGLASDAPVHDEVVCHAAGCECEGRTA